MNIATTLNSIMTIMWGDEQEDDSTIVIALASYIRSHGRRNHENVFDVIDILWADNVKTISQRSLESNQPADKEKFGQVLDYLVEVQFDDESQLLVICRNGIGHGIALT